MARVSIYLNFLGKTEEAFQFYKEVFGNDLSAPVSYMKDVPEAPGAPKLPENEKNKVMHIELPLLGDMVLMGTDALESMGHKISFGNNIYINLEPDTRAETEKLFKGLSEGGTNIMSLQEMFWGGYYGSCIDKYGVQWMFNCANK